MSRSTRAHKQPARFNPSLSNEHSQLEGQGTDSYRESCSTKSSPTSSLFDDDEPIDILVDCLLCYPADFNTQFWSWRFNNCAITVFMVSTELVFEQLRLASNQDSLFGRVVRTRCDEPKPRHDRSMNTFDLFHEQTTGKKNRSCKVHGSRGISPCCGFGNFVPYTTYADEMEALFGGDKYLCNAVSMMSCRRLGKGVYKRVYPTASMSQNQPMAEAVTSFLSCCVRSPPKIIFLSLDHSPPCRDSPERLTS